jgi:TonB family protein
MKFFYTLTLVFTATLCFAQRQNVYFLKNNGQYVDVRDSADYIRVVREPDSASVLYNVSEFYLNGKQKLVGKSVTIDPPKYDGQCAVYYANGKRKSLINYKKGVITGEDFEFYPNGKPYLELTYPDDKQTKTHEFGSEYLIQSNIDSLGNALVTDGNGYYKEYDDKFSYIEEEGNVKSGKRDGQWKGIYKNVHTTFTETYDNGKLISGKAITDDGVSSTYSGSRRVHPEFQGGIEAFGKYLVKNVHYPAEARQKNIQGTVILSFVVEKSGDLTDIKVARSVTPILDEEAIRVLKNSPKWVPGTQFGLPVRVQYSVPISYTMRY